MSESKNTLNVCEHFYSIQGEGITSGVPAYFIRFSGCNLECGLSINKLQQIKQAGRGNTPSGSLASDIGASWVCDTAPVWLFGDQLKFQELWDVWQNKTLLDGTTLLSAIAQGRVHIVWTGGEPLLPKYQKDILAFRRWFRQKLLDINFTDNSFCEIETNGTQTVIPELITYIDQINCSPKLANSGMSKERRIVGKALTQINVMHKSQFKFVITSCNDMVEILNDFAIPFGLSRKKIVLMPGLDDQKDFHKMTKLVMEVARDYGVIGLTRLHVSAWNKTVSC